MEFKILVNRAIYIFMGIPKNYRDTPIYISNAQRPFTRVETRGEEERRETEKVESGVNAEPI